MRILYLSQYFPPEVGATQTRAYEMARGLVKAGHQVTILAEFPNHPHGIIPPEYRGKLVTRTELDGIDVLRVWVRATPEKSYRSRMSFYLSYMIMAVFTGIFFVTGKYDAIYATSPPLFVGGAALAISWFRRIPMFFEVRDLWPESAVTLGVLKSSRSIRWATRLEEACYRRARRIILTTQEMVDNLAKRGIPKEKMQVIRNGANTDLFRFSSEDRSRIRTQLKVDDEFLVVYAGLFGIAQALDSVLDGVQRLQEQGKSVHFLFIGDGPRKQSLLDKAKGLKLSNTTFLPSQPREKIPGYLSAADAAIVPLTKRRLFGALPSKMFDAMACERPVILSVEGEAAQVLRESKAGLVIPPEDSDALCRAVTELMQDPEKCRQYGMRGRTAVVAQYSRQAQSAQLAELLESVLMG